MKNILRNSNFGFTKWCVALIAAGWMGSSAFGQVRISQAYGGGGNTGATFKNDFIELYNAGSSAVSLAGWSIQYSSSSATTATNTITLLSGSIGPKQYFLIQEAAGTGGTQNLPTPDVTGTIAMSGTAFKLALVNNSTPLIGSTPANSTGIVDYVGVGSANIYEGSGTAPAPSNTTAIFRKNGGETDSNNNASDFETGTPNPRNSLSGGGSATPVITLNPTSLSGLTATTGANSSVTNYTVTGTNLGTTNITVTPNSSLIEISTNASTGFATNALALAPTAGVVSNTVYVRIANVTTATNFSSSISHVSGTATTNLAVSGQVVAPSSPSVTVSPASATGLTSYAGQFSTSTNYTVTGSNLGTTNLVVTVSTNAIEVSTNSSTGFTNTLSLAPSSGALSNTVYVRMSALAPVGAVSGTVSNVSGSASNDFTVSGTVTAPALTLNLNPATVVENAGANASTGTVGIPTALSSNLTINLVSSNTAAATVPSTVTITNGQTNATFPIAAVVYNANTNVPVIITASATNYTSASATLTLTDVPTSADLTASGYRQDFSTFTTTQQALPTGWALNGAVVSFMSDPTAATYGVEWGNTNGTVTNPGAGGGLRAQTNGGVLGYQHTGNTGTLVELLTLKNATANTITDLTISYKGRVTRPLEGRSPSYTVKIDAGTAIAALGYSTVEADNVAKSAVVSGLNIQPGATFTINWSSDRATGSGSSKQIGMSDVSVSIGSNIFAPSVGLVSLNEATLSQTSATINGSVTADGGTTITERGFVYCLTSVSSNPVIGGSGVTKIGDAAVTVDALNATLTGLAVNSGYTVRAYAINAQGTTYSTALSFTTLQNNPSFTGNYTQDFSTFSSMTSFPAGWRCLSGANVYAGDFLTSSSSSAGFLGGTSGAGVLGYQHTSTSGTLTNKLTLVNGTGSALSTLYVSYQGKVALTSNTRSPAWTVKVNGTTVTDLAYSTANGVDEAKTAQITGLSVAAGETFTISWESDRGTVSGNSRRIGIANVNVSVNAPTPTGSTYTGWLNGVTPSDAAFLDYVFGAATPGTLDASLKPTSAVTGGNLVITAIVRVDDPKLTVEGQAVTDLANYASGTSIVTVPGSAVGVDQTNVPSGCQRKTFTVAQGADAKKFLRLSATLAP
jgi:hypothetical protein